MEEEEQIIQKIVVPDYPDRILISKRRRAVYYVSKRSGLRGNQLLPKRYANKVKYGYNDKGVLVELKAGTPILSNPRTAGKERYWVVNFQEIWNGATSRQSRAGRINTLKDILRPFIQKVQPVRVYPVGIEIHLYNTEFNIDASNKGVIYTKIIEDLLVTEGKLIDDSAEYVNDTGRIVLHKVKRKEEIRMEINILKSRY